MICVFLLKRLMRPVLNKVYYVNFDDYRLTFFIEDIDKYRTSDKCEDHNQQLTCSNSDANFVSSNDLLTGDQRYCVIIM